MSNQDVRDATLGNVVVYDTATWQAAKTSGAASLAAVTGLKFSGAGTQLIESWADEGATIWDVAKWRKVGRLADKSFAISLSEADGRLAISTGREISVFRSRP